MAADIDLAVLYQLLSGTARAAALVTYGGLSEQYAERTGDHLEPHGTWDHPLGQINQRAFDAGLPPLSAVVVLGDTQEPGGGFWGSSPGVPPRPRDPVDRVAAYASILSQVHATAWPEQLPG